MKKHIKILFILIIILTGITGCKNKKEKELITEESVQDISELSSLEVIYHTVAKVDWPKGKSLIQKITEVDRQQWYEFTSSVIIGVKNIKVKSVKMRKNNKDADIVIEMSHAEILEIDQKSEEQSVIKTKDSRLNKNEIPNAEIDKAYAKARKEVLDKINNNKDYFKTAESNAKLMIQNLYDEIGEENDIKYHIEFKFIEE